ncbi:GntR family transcriptional regulator [Motiliproteus coralliicola]|uniref:Pyruvate dehydrogenase complex repressor n=1 Tax=Motiliproteus coralliicola TaxID=2283196 RepID=A0A369WEX1_9GAMM|nr:FCD domain-containing protein [Motiliproteus coralliicola]RDE19901.1 GntR family transcriptional regulator [Motiliproteus coralliicola]
MKYRRVKQPKISDVIMEELESMILEGSLKPGQKLPSERELSKQFEVSRPSLREAVQKLVAKGLLTSRQGGGTYVSDTLDGGYADPLLTLFSSHPEAQADLLEFRHALEGVAAYYAALRSTESDRRAIQKIYDELEGYHEAKAFEQEVKADVEFHLRIAEASHNVVLLHTMRALLGLVEKNIMNNLEQAYPQRGHRSKIHGQHKVLMDAIFDGKPEQARQAAYDHLVYVEEVVSDYGKEEARQERSRRRSELNK